MATASTTLPTTAAPATAAAASKGTLGMTFTGLIVRIVLATLGCAALVWLRGKFMAVHVGGHYLWSSMLWETTNLTLHLLLVFAVDTAVRALLLHRIRRRLWRGAGSLLLILLMGTITTAMLLTWNALYPARISPGADAIRPAVTFPMPDGTRLEATLFEAGQLPAQAATPPVVAAAVSQPAVSQPGVARAAPCACVIIVHGVGANRGNFLHVGRWLDDCHVLMIDLPNHGRSGGWQTHYGLSEWRAVQTAERWLRQRYPGLPVYAMGYSMGGAAVLLAAEHGAQLDRIVVDSTFADFGQVARSTVLAPLGSGRDVTWHIARSIAWMMSGHDLATLRPVTGVARTAARTPLLIIHGTGDFVVPLEQGQQLHQAAPDASFWEIPNARHVCTAAPGYRERIRAFLLDE